MKLRPKLRRAIINIHELLKTCDSTVTLAHRMEINMLKSQGKSIRSQHRDTESTSN